MLGEKKASGMALNVAAHYPDRPQLLSAMVDLAVEELAHYKEVIRLMLTRGVQPLPDTKDRYVAQLNSLIRRGTELFLLDRLLVAAVIERRGAERFSLLARALDDSETGTFYRAIASSEERHWQLFIELAHQECANHDITTRFNELLEQEGNIVRQLALAPRLH